MLDSSVSVAAPAEAIPAAAGVSRSGFNLPHKPLKVVAAAGVLFAGAFGVLSENKYVSSSDAVVSTYVLSVRTPVDGVVTGLPLSAGVMVRQGQLLGEIANPLADHQHLDNLRTLQEEAQATASAAGLEQRILSDQRNELIQRSASHLSAVQDRLKEEVAAAEQVLRARQLQYDEAQREADRGKQLYELGVTSQADYEKLTAVEDVAEQQLAAQKSNVGSLRLQLAAAGQGILAEPGTNNDVPYSRQRADELAIKLADNERVVATSRIQAKEAQMAVLEESARTQMMQHSVLASPIEGLIWKLNAVNGEHAAAGDEVVSLVDCQRQFLLAEIPQNRIPDVALHQKATFRLAGEPNERTGTVLSVSGDSLRQDEDSLAALPAKASKKDNGLVLIGIDKSENGQTECLVGRDARVLIPTNPNSTVARWFRGYF